MRYVIRVKGHLDPSWQEWFDHLSITHQSDGTTCFPVPSRTRQRSTASSSKCATWGWRSSRSRRARPYSLQRS